MDLPSRKRLRLANFDYSSGNYYFITICTKNRACIFSHFVGNGFIRSAVGTIAEEHLRNIPAHHPQTVIDKYVIMPNHVHMIAAIGCGDAGRINPSPTISDVIGQYKAGVSRAAGFPVWQKSFYDHVIRNETDYREIWRYIDENPMKWTLDSLFINP